MIYNSGTAHVKNVKTTAVSVCDFMGDMVTVVAVESLQRSSLSTSMSMVVASRCAILEIDLAI